MDKDTKREFDQTTEDIADGHEVDNVTYENYEFKYRYLPHQAEVKCPSDYLVTKFHTKPKEETKTHYTIRNKAHQSQYLTVNSCIFPGILRYSTKLDTDIVQQTFYWNDDGNNLHSALCGDEFVVELENKYCKKGRIMRIGKKGDSNNARKITKMDNNMIKVTENDTGDPGFCLLDGGRIADEEFVFVRRRNYDKESYRGDDWMYWDFKEEPRKIREITCMKPNSSVGLKILNNETKTTDFIRSHNSGTCPKEYYVYGYECKDYFCREFRLLCRKVQVRL